LNVLSVRRWMTECAQLMHDNRDYLTQLDAAIGDADHGSNMTRGFDAVAAHIVKLENKTPGALLLEIANTLISSVGGASGPLWGSVFRGAGRAAGSSSEITLAGLGDALEAGLHEVVELGAAKPGEKTMVDALGPAVQAVRASVQEGSSLEAGVNAARLAAEQGQRDTVLMLARKGRAAYLGERSIGHQDPGATSVGLVLLALEKALADDV
jgi:phosphoenolpyruvate---glycerone phosphotransferase subunit DhaL